MVPAVQRKLGWLCLTMMSHLGTYLMTSHKEGGGGWVYHLFVMQARTCGLGHRSMIVGQGGQKKSKFVWRLLWIILWCKFVLEILPILSRSKKVIFVKIKQEKKKCNFSNMGNIGLPKITFVKRKLKQKLKHVTF